MLHYNKEYSDFKGGRFMTAWKYLRSALLANFAVIATFVFLPIFLLTDNISIYQDLINYLNKS